MKSKFLGILLISLLQFNAVFSQSKWDSLATLQNAPGLPVMAAANGKIYVFSGVTSANAPTYEYDPATDSWSQKAPIPQGCYWASAATVDNKIYVMGGGHPYPGNKYNFIYDPVTDTWDTGADMLTGRMYHSAAVANDKIYLIGGQNGDGTSEWYFEEYDPKNDTWSTKAQLPRNGAWYAGAAGVGDFVYRIAGGGSSNTLIRDWVDVYDINSNSWKSEKNLHRGLHAPATVTYGKSIFVLGGYSNFTEMDSVWILDTDTRTWHNANFKLREKRVYHKAAIIDSCIYIYGGQNNISGKLDGSLTRYCMSGNVSIKENPVSEINIFPNPASNYLNIETTLKIDGYVITNILGHTIEENLYSNKELKNINLQDYPAGVYVLQLFSEYQNYTKIFQVIR